MIRLNHTAYILLAAPFLNYGKWHKVLYTDYGTDAARQLDQLAGRVVDAAGGTHTVGVPGLTGHIEHALYVPVTIKDLNPSAPAVIPLVVPFKVFSDTHPVPYMYARHSRVSAAIVDVGEYRSVDDMAYVYLDEPMLLALTDVSGFLLSIYGWSRQFHLDALRMAATYHWRMSAITDVMTPYGQMGPATRSPVNIMSTEAALAQLDNLHFERII